MRPQIIFTWRAVVMQILLGALCQAEKEDMTIHQASDKTTEHLHKKANGIAAYIKNITSIHKHLKDLIEKSSLKMEQDLSDLKSELIEISSKQSDVKYLKMEQDLSDLKSELMEISSKQSDDKYLKMEQDLSDLKSELSTVKTAASRMCQTGTIKAGRFGEKMRKPDSGYSYVSTWVTFSPPFTSAPKISMATSRLEMQASGGYDRRGVWGFSSRASVMTKKATGFDGSLFVHHDGKELFDIWANWIACGTVQV